MEKSEAKQQILFENRSVTLSLIGQDILLIAYKNRALNDEYRLNLIKQVELVKQHKCTKALFDLRKMGVLSTDNQQYTSEVYMPQIAEAGLRHSALIVPEDVFGEASAKNVTNKVKDNVVLSMRYFNNFPEGLEWLESL